MGALMGGARQYYVLEHRTSSKYHRAGETQKIIVDQVEMGRDPRCQIRFDDSFTSVSRRHAAIVRDGAAWKLVHLSKVNPTLLNGRPVADEWYLQNGDEIQLSSNGPRMGFMIPQGDRSMIKNINFTERFSLFRQQALRPYKQMLIGMSVVFLLVIGGLVAFSALFDYNPVWWLCIFILIAGILGTARIILRHHTLGEVMGGFAVGLICSLLVLHPLTGWLFFYLKLLPL